MKLPINNNFLEIVLGNIADQETEAIVNAANNHLWMGSGVAGEIKQKGGDSIEKEAVEKGPIQIGSAVLTSAGKLKSKYVIHAAVMGQDLHAGEKNIQDATRSSLQVADKNNIKSLSLPALGTGIGGFSVFHCAKIMLSESIEFLTRSKSLHHIRFVLFDKPAFDAFEEELRMQFSAKRH